jgi:predicted RNase H-like HicB family nuclease
MLSGQRETPQETEMRPTVFTVIAQWDAEARVWVAMSDDVPGLATEAETLDELERKLTVMVPELLELNDGSSIEDGEVPIDLIARRHSRERCPA